MAMVFSRQAFVWPNYLHSWFFLGISKFNFGAVGKIRFNNGPLCDLRAIISLEALETFGVRIF